MPPAALKPALHQMIERILSGDNIPVVERSPLEKIAFKKISLHALQLKIVHNPVSGKRENRIVSLGKIVSRTTEIKDIIKSFNKETKGAGSKRLYDLISKHFYGVTRDDIIDWLKSDKVMCKLRPKFDNKAPLKPVQSLEPMERHQIDIVDLTAIAEKKGEKTYKYVLSILDIFSRFLWLVPLEDKSSNTVAQSLSDIYLNHQWGTPQKIQSDQGGEFKGTVKTLVTDLVSGSFTQGPIILNRKESERSHRTWKECLRYDIQHLGDVSWVDSLPDYCRIHNESLCSSLGTSPYKAMFGFEPHRLARLLKAGHTGKESTDYEVEECEGQKPVEVDNDDLKVSEDVRKRLKELSLIRKDILKKSKQAETAMIERAKKKNPLVQYEIGQNVLVRQTGPGKGVKRGGQKMSSPRATEGTVLKFNQNTNMYQIQSASRISWCKVDDITSLRQSPRKKKKESDKNWSAENVKKKLPFEDFTPDARGDFTSDVCSSEAEFLEILEKLAKFSSSPSTPHSLESLEQMASNRGLFVRHNQGGGDCMFLSLSHQIYHQLDLEMNALEVRDMVVDHLLRNPTTIDGTHLRNFVSGKKSWRTYLAEMEKAGTWGDNLMLMGASDVLEVQIKVISTISDEPIVIKPQKKKVGSKTLFLGHVAEFHYVSLEKKAQWCKTCRMNLPLCRCADSINVGPADSDDSQTSPNLSSENKSEDDGSLRVTPNFFERKKKKAATYLQSLLQGKFRQNKEGRGKRHMHFITHYPYHEVNAGFGSDFVSADMYGQILQWIENSFTRRLLRDKSRPYTMLATQIFTVKEVDEDLRKIPLKHTEAVWHYVLYVAVKEVIVFLIEELTGRNFRSVDKICQETEMRPKEL